MSQSYPLSLLPGPLKWRNEMIASSLKKTVPSVSLNTTQPPSLPHVLPRNLLPLVSPIPLLWAATPHAMLQLPVATIRQHKLCPNFCPSLLTLSGLSSQNMTVVSTVIYFMQAIDPATAQTLGRMLVHINCSLSLWPWLPHLHLSNWWSPLEQC